MKILSMVHVTPLSTDLKVHLSVQKLFILIIIGLDTMNHITHNEDEDIGGHIPLHIDNDWPEDDFDGNPNKDNGIDDNNDMDHGFENNQDDFKDGEHECDDLDAMDIEVGNRRPDSPQAGQKHPRCDSDPAQPVTNKFRKAIKMKNSKGKPKADDWEPDVQEILTKAILFYECRLVTEGLFPDHMEEVTWAKVAWLDECDDCGLKIHHNSELIKIVRFSFFI